MDTSTADPMVGTVLDGRYRLDARIARGGMATVYVGFDTRLDRPVAVKVMHASLADDEAFVERFRREAKSAARLSHPAVVAIYDQGEDDGRVYLVMEHVNGRTLRALLRENGRIPAAQALDFVDGVLAALAAAHAAGLVHRDVKPENVLVLPDGTVKVADFGLARAIEATNHTVADGTLLGTVAYLAPEQVATGAADPRADLYALGVVLFEMLTGQVPYDGGTPLAVAYRHVNEDVPDPSTVAPDVPRVAGNVVRAATRRNLDERYPDAETMVSAVRRARSALGSADTAMIRLDEAPTLITKLPTTPPPPATPVAAKKDKAPKGPRRHRPWVVFLAVATAVLLVSGVAGWYLATGRYSRAPGLVGLDRAAAVRALSEAGLKLRTGTPVYSDTVPKDAVAKQSPGSGERVKRGTVVTIQLSRGVRMVKVPNVLAKPLKEAEAALAAADLALGTVTRRYDKVLKGYVIGITPKHGTSVKHGSKVSLVVSDGLAPVRIPDLRNEVFSTARDTLHGIGLRVALREEFSDSVEAGRVISMSPAQGTTVPADSTVTLRVSKGPELVTVPEVRGERVQTAKDRLEKLGLTVTIDHIRGGNGQVVLDQDPQAGTRVRRGTNVNLAVY